MSEARYRIQRSGFKWQVYCGTGTRPVLHFWRWHTAATVAAVLNGAFLDGIFIATRGAT